MFKTASEDSIRNNRVNIEKAHTTKEYIYL
jgi:hypothetical protein